MMGPHILIIADDDVTVPMVLRIDGEIRHIRVPRVMYQNALEWLPMTIRAAAELGLVQAKNPPKTAAAAAAGREQP